MNFRYVVALLLMRRRRLKFEDLKKANGQEIIPAKYNTGSSVSNRIFNPTVHLHVNGPIDTRTQHQLAAAAYDGMRRATFRNR